MFLSDIKISFSYIIFLVLELFYIKKLSIIKRESLYFEDFLPLKFYFLFLYLSFNISSIMIGTIATISAPNILKPPLFYLIRFL